MSPPGPSCPHSRSRSAIPLVLLASLVAGCIRGAASGASTLGSAAATPEAANLEAERRLQSVARVDLLGPRGLALFQLEGQTRKVTLTTIPVQGQPFGSALRAAITEGSESEWSVQLVAANAQPIEKGWVSSDMSERTWPATGGAAPRSARCPLRQGCIPAVPQL